jgi:hypothetical protein
LRRFQYQKVKKARVAREPKARGSQVLGVGAVSVEVV